MSRSTRGPRGHAAVPRASIVARARFIEDLVVEQAARGVGQYVLLGAGLDTFVQRRPEIAARLSVFEVDQPGTQIWKRQRLVETGYGLVESLELVPVDFEAGESWRQKPVAAGFDGGRPAVVSSTGVSMYLTREAILALLREVAALAPGTTFAMSFLLPLEMAKPAVRLGMGGEGRAGERHAVHQLLQAGRDRGHGVRGSRTGPTACARRSMPRIADRDDVASPGARHSSAAHFFFWAKENPAADAGAIPQQMRVVSPSGTAVPRFQRLIRGNGTANAP